MNKLKKSIDTSGLKRADICKRADISRTHLFYLEKDLRKPSFDIINKLSKILNKTPQELFFSEYEN